MTISELRAAERHLKEVVGLCESATVIANARQRVAAAKAALEPEVETASESADPVTSEEPADPEPPAEEPTENPGDDSLAVVGLSDRIIDVLQDNAELLEDDRLLSVSGLREWVAEGNDLSDDLDGIGPKFKAAIQEAIN